MYIDNEVKLDFSDVLIRPKRSTLESRSQVDLIKKFKTAHGVEFSGVPIIAANMATGTFEMLDVFSRNKMFVAIAKHFNDKWPEYFKENPIAAQYGFYTIGMSQSELDVLEEFSALYPDVKICIDIANGYTQRFASFVERVRLSFPTNVIIAGNVATPEMVQELVIAGADYVKIGLGPGQNCLTRKKTGVGYPQISAAIECFKPDTLIESSSGYKQISQINIGDMVLTHKNRYKKVLRIITKKENNFLYNINNNMSTKNHKYFVLNKKYIDIANDDNIHEYAEWISAENLTKDYMLLEINK